MMAATRFQVGVGLILGEVLVGQKQHAPGLMHQNFTGPLDGRSINQRLLVIGAARVDRSELLGLLGTAGPQRHRRPVMLSLSLVVLIVCGLTQFPDQLLGVWRQIDRFWIGPHVREVASAQLTGDIVIESLPVLDVKRRDEYFPGRHQPLVGRMTFERCQDILLGRNRRTGNPSHAYAGGLFHCAFCGSLITGEKFRRNLKGGGVRVHQYYRCANNDRTEDHPQVRWREADLEESVISELSRLQIFDVELRGWFREALTAAFSDLTSHEAQQRKQLKKRQSELQTMQDRLLHAYLTGTVDEAVYRTKTTDFQREGATLEERIGKVGDTPADAGEIAVKLFDWTQNADEFWSRSKVPVRREILSALSLNRTLSDVSLVIEKRKPFDILAEGLNLEQSRVKRI
jgi:hypothetical protein